MAGPGLIKDRGIRGLLYTDKIVRTQGASWFEPGGGVVFFDDFLGDTVATDNWLQTAIDATDGTGTYDINASAGSVAGHGGWLRMKAGGAAATDTATSVEIGFGANGGPVSGFKSSRAGNGLMVFEARVSIPTTTEIRINAGLTDDPTEGSALAASLSTTTFTTTATNGHLWLFDTDATTDVFRGISVSGGTDSSGTIAGGAPTAGTAYRLRIEVDTSANSFWYIDDIYKGVQIADSSSASSILLTPYFGVTKASGATGGMSQDVDYVLVACGR